MLPWEGAVDADSAESWLFPSVAAPKRAPRRSRTRRRAAADRATPPGEASVAPPGAAAVAASDVASAGEPAPRPAGVRRRKSAFAAARSAN